jgi:transcription initiation factor IIF auxiliary subunit
MRGWNISIYLLSPEGEELPATCFEKATYILHDSFGPKRMRQTIRRPPFTIHEKGWGEFDMQIQLTPIGAAKSSEHTIAHDLNFQQERYESTHNITFRNPKGALLDALRDSGDVGDPAPKPNGVTSTPAPGQAKEKKVRKNQNRNVDMEKLAEALPQLGEEDLLQVVQMVHDNKTDDTYTKNDVDSELARRFVVTDKHTNDVLPPDGEFHVDLYTLPDQLIKMLWDFTSNRVNMNELA